MVSRRIVVTGAATLAASAAIPGAWAQAPAGPFKLEPLPYPVDKNEPYIDAMTMELHHGKHHAGYVKNLNDAVQGHADLARMQLPELLRQLGAVSESLRAAIRNNGGGHANHAMFWQILGGSGGAPTGEVGAAIGRDLGGFDALRSAFNTLGEKQFGSGWVFVTVDRAGSLGLVATPNQDTPLMDGRMVLMGNDVWEHAYYLKYRNRRPDYLKAWWNVLDWNRINERYAAAKAGELTL